MANTSNAQIEYPVPSVEHAQGPTLNPLLVRGGAKAVIELDDMFPSETYTVYFKGPLAEANPVIAPQQGNHSGRLEFFIPRKLSAYVLVIRCTFFIPYSGVGCF